jgi:geranylgeranyl diphosphate synthase type II
MHAIQFRIFITYLEKQTITKEPENLYEPLPIYGVRGKRIRPVLTLMTTEVWRL